MVKIDLETGELFSPKAIYVPSDKHDLGHDLIDLANIQQHSQTNDIGLLYLNNIIQRVLLKFQWPT